MWLLQTIVLVVALLRDTQGVLIDGAAFSEELDTIAIFGLKHSALQSHISSNVAVSNVNVSSGILLAALSTAMSTRILSRFQLAQSLKASVEAHIGSYRADSPLEECCNVRDTWLEYDPRFKTRVSRTRMCYRKSSQAASLPLMADNNLLETFKSNIAAVPGVKWMYYGNEDGVLFNYPYTPATDCQSYDPRLRPWYVEGATLIPKDVVIVIDKSGSMDWSSYGGHTLMEIAKEAAKTIVDMLNPRDRVGLVKFSTYASTPEITQDSSDCYATSLAKATSPNRRALKAWIDGIIAGGGTYYSRGLSKAFDLISNSPNDTESNRRKVILFVTDGEPTDSFSDIEATIETGNALESNSVSILTFGVGQGITTTGETTLTQMTTMHQNTAGLFTRVLDVGHLRMDMATYYNYFPKADHSEPTLTEPYYDAFGLGMVMTVVLPIYHNAVFKGVVGVDVSLGDMLGDLSYLKSEGGYVFMVNRQGTTLYHPLLAMPTTITEDSVNVNIDVFETDEGAAAVINSLKQGHSGSATFESKHILSRGDAHTHGIEVTTGNATYQWTAVLDTPTALCVVGRQAEWMMPLYTLTSHPPTLPFTYHRLDLQDVNTCRYFARVAIREDTSVKFGPEAFLEPFEYLDTEENAAIIDKYTDFIKDTGSNQFEGLKQSTRDSVAITAKAHELWTTSTAVEYSVWRYIGVYDGTIRISPAISVHKHYSPLLRPWYKGAALEPDSMRLSSPYLDSFGAGYVITLSAALTVDGHVFGVMGIDFTVSYFYLALTLRLTRCAEEGYSCFVMDKAGYLVIHKDFITTSGSENPIVENVHVTVKEKAVADYLIRNSIMVRKDCNNVKDIRKQYFYEVSLASKLISSDPEFELEPLHGTNVFVGIIRTSSSSPSCSCLDERSSVPPQCTGTGTCQCPCYQGAVFNYCQNEFTDSIQPSWRVCMPAPPSVNMTADLLLESTLLPNLDFCFDRSCETLTTRDDCYRVAGCSFCEFGEDGTVLDEPYCAEQEACFFGQRAFPSPYDMDEMVEEGGVNVMAIIFGTGFVLLVIAVAGCIACIAMGYCSSSTPVEVPVAMRAFNPVEQTPPAVPRGPPQQPMTINVNVQTPQPSPQQPVHQHQPTYPTQQPAYPTQQPAYPTQQPAYPTQQPAYPTQQPMYPQQAMPQQQQPMYQQN